MVIPVTKIVAVCQWMASAVLQSSWVSVLAKLQIHAILFAVAVQHKVLVVPIVRQSIATAVRCVMRAVVVLHPATFVALLLTIGRRLVAVERFVTRIVAALHPATFVALLLDIHQRFATVRKYVMRAVVV